MLQYAQVFVASNVKIWPCYQNFCKNNYQPIGSKLWFHYVWVKQFISLAVLEIVYLVGSAGGGDLAEAAARGPAAAVTGREPRTRSWSGEALLWDTEGGTGLCHQSDIGVPAEYTEPAGGRVGNTRILYVWRWTQGQSCSHSCCVPFIPVLCGRRRWVISVRKMRMFSEDCAAPVICQYNDGAAGWRTGSIPNRGRIFSSHK